MDGIVVNLVSVNDFAEWRAAARQLLRRGVPPGAIEWCEPISGTDLIAAVELSGRDGVQRDRPAGRVPPRFVGLARAVVCHRNPDRFGLLYSLLWRLQKDRQLIVDLDDPEVSRLNRRMESVVLDYKRMRAELRFRRAVAADGHKGLRAWHTPEHYVLERVAVHFAHKVAHEDWLIETPYRSASWDGKSLTFGAGRDGAGR